jgi:tetratricopeptide (TPR) repeat protein
MGVAAVRGARAEGRAREGALLAAIALPWLAMVLLIHPPQGMFRDWDDYAAAGVALSMLTAWACAVAIERAPSWAWLCVPLALGAAAPSLHVLLHNADLTRGLERIEAYLREPPQRSEEERAKNWDFLGIRFAQLDRWDRSADAMAHAAEFEPSPRVLLQWASAEQARGNDTQAHAVYARLVAMTPDDGRAWLGLAFVSWRQHDWAECRRAARALMRIRPGDPQAQHLRDELNRVDPAHAETAR